METELGNSRTAKSRASYRFADYLHHFEKMLHDNAQLARVYLHVWQVTGSDAFRTTTEEILDYVVRNSFRPLQVVALGSPHGQRFGRHDVQLAQARQLPSNAADPVCIAAVPLLQDRGLVEERATACCSPKLSVPSAGRRAEGSGQTLRNP